MNTVSTVREARRQLRTGAMCRLSLPASRGLLSFAARRIPNPAEGYVFTKSRKALRLLPRMFCVGVVVWQGVRGRYVVVLKKEADNWYLYFLPKPAEPKP